MTTVYDQKDPIQIRNRIKNLRWELDRLESELHRAESSCRHVWPEPKYDPIRTEAYTIPADPVGTMGIDWRGESYVPATTKPRWTRTCPKCGKVETTEICTTVESKMPVFR